MIIYRLIAMCFICVWKRGLAHKYLAPILLEYNVGCLARSTLSWEVHVAIEAGYIGGNRGWLCNCRLLLTWPCDYFWTHVDNIVADDLHPSCLRPDPIHNSPLSEDQMHGKGEVREQCLYTPKKKRRNNNNNNNAFEPSKYMLQGQKETMLFVT